MEPFKRFDRRPDVTTVIRQIVSQHPVYELARVCRTRAEPVKEKHFTPSSLQHRVCEQAANFSFRFLIIFTETLCVCRKGAVSVLSSSSQIIYLSHEDTDDETATFSTLVLQKNAAM